MRGFPLLRTFFVLVALVASGFGFRQLTAGKGVGPAVAPAKPSAIVSQQIPARVWVTLSSPGGYIGLKAGNRNVNLSMDEDGRFVGDAMIETANPVMFLKVACGPALMVGKTNFFVKLEVEAEGEKTFTHVFDSPGDIDDFVELPF